MKNKKMRKVILDELAKATRKSGKSLRLEISYEMTSYDQSVTKLYTILSNYTAVYASGRLKEILIFLKDIDLAERMATPIVKSTKSTGDATT